MINIRKLSLVVIVCLIIVSGSWYAVKTGQRPDDSGRQTSAVQIKSKPDDKPYAKNMATAQKKLINNAQAPQTLVVLPTQQAKQAFIQANGLSDDKLKPSRSLADTYIVSKTPDQLDAAGATISPRLKYRALFTFTNQDPIYPQWFTDIIKAPQAWDISTGSTDTTVAVIDTGFALSHQDLVGRWVNGGKDFANDDNNPAAGSTNPDGDAVDHGTLVAGLVGATGNNGVGVASVNWQTKILPIQALDDDGLGWTDDIVAAVDYAVSQGADVISMSLGSTENDVLLAAAISNAVAAGVVPIASAGNCGSSYALQGCDYQGQMLYPAKLDSVIAVGATTSTDTRASFSSYGSELDIMAPGSGSIRTTTWQESDQISAYSNSVAGTSFSAPIVSGIAALHLGIKSQTLAQLKQKLTDTAERVNDMGGSNFTDFYGYGRVDINESLRFYVWPGNNTAFRLIECDGQKYMVERFIRMKRALGNDAIEAWQLSDATFNAGDKGCSYGSYVIPLGRTLRSRDTTITYLVDSQKAYRLQSSSIARAWGLSTEYSQSTKVPLLKGKTINQLQAVLRKLPRLAESDNTSEAYLLNSGNKHYLSGSPGNNESLRLFRGYDHMPLGVFSAGLLATLGDGDILDFYFKCGDAWFLADHGKTRQIKDQEVTRWQSIVGDGPTLSTDIKAILPSDDALGKGFQRSGTFYRVMDDGSIESTTSITTAKAWGVYTSPEVTNLLRNKLVN